jgi:hydrogenase maturation factor
MCQAPVGKVVDVARGELTVDYKGTKRKLRSRLDGIEKGDYVAFSTGIAIDKVEPEEAKAMLGE